MCQKNICKYEELYEDGASKRKAGSTTSRPNSRSCVAKPAHLVLLGSDTGRGACFPFQVRVAAVG